MAAFHDPILPLYPFQYLSHKMCVSCITPSESCMCLSPFSSRGQKRNINAAKRIKVWHNSLFSGLKRVTVVQFTKERLLISEVTRLRGKKQTFLRDLFKFRPLSYHTPSRYIWTQIWPQTVNTSRWQRRSQTAGRRTSLPDRTRQVSVFCYRHCMSIRPA